MNEERKKRPLTRRRGAGLVGIGLLLLAAVLCARLLLAPKPDRPNIILISIDTLRADHVHGYGYGPDTTPFIDSLMEQGTSFMQATSPAPWTLPAHLSLFTSLYPHTHGVVNDQYGLADNILTLPMVLKEAKYRTCAYTSCIYLFPGYGYDRGFDIYLNRNKAPSTLLCRDAAEWLKQESDQPFFLFLHFFDVHPPYMAKDRYVKMFESSYSGDVAGSMEELTAVNEGVLKLSDEDLRHLVAVYDAGIRQLDDSLSDFMQFVAANALDKNTYIIVTSDHGEEFLDHGMVMHTRTMYDELLRVPMIILGPGIPAGKRIDRQVELIDIFPSILELCGIRIPRGLEGKSMLPLIRGEVESLHDYTFAEADWDVLNKIQDIYRAARTENYKLYYNTQTGEERFFDLVSDPGEKVDIRQEKPELVRAYRQRLDEWMSTKRGTPRKVDFTSDKEDLLRSLGYLN